MPLSFAYIAKQAISNLVFEAVKLAYSLLKDQEKREVVAQELRELKKKTKVFFDGVFEKSQESLSELLEIVHVFVIQSLEEYSESSDLKEIADKVIKDLEDKIKSLFMTKK